MTGTITYYSDDKCTTSIGNAESFVSNVCKQFTATFSDGQVSPSTWGKYNCTTEEANVGSIDPGGQARCQNNGGSSQTFKKNNCDTFVDPIDGSPVYFKITGCPSDDLSGGDIAGIVVGSIAGLILLGYIYYRYYRKGKGVKITGKGKKK